MGGCGLKWLMLCLCCQLCLVWVVWSRFLLDPVYSSQPADLARGYWFLIWQVHPKLVIQSGKSVSFAEASVGFLSFFFICKESRDTKGCRKRSTRFTQPLQKDRLAAQPQPSSLLELQVGSSLSGSLYSQQARPWSLASADTCTWQPAGLHPSFLPKLVILQSVFSYQKPGTIHIMFCF